MLLREIVLKQLFATPAGQKPDLRNTLFFNILRANPSLAIFYPDLLRSLNANPSLIRDLQTRSAKFFPPDQSPQNPTTKTKKGSNSMALNANARVCTHIKVNGVRCGSPALRKEVFCYFHQRMIRGVRTPPKSRLHPIANFEDAQAIQASLMEVVNALVRNHIDVPRARLILRALSIAAQNASKTHFGFFKSDMVEEVPEYPTAPPITSPFEIAAAEAPTPTSKTTQQKQEPHPNRPSNPVQPAPTNAHSNAPRKPPTSVKTAPHPRPATSRAG
jgi:hypothetical protein